VYGAPIGVFGFVVGALLVLGALLPSAALERTNRIGRVPERRARHGPGGLLHRGTAQPLPAVHELRRAGRHQCRPVPPRRRRFDSDDGPFRRYAAAPPMHLGVFGLAVLLAGWAGSLYHEARRGAERGAATTQVVTQFLALQKGAEPSFISPYWVVRSTERFEDAPLRIIEYSDFMCSDCRYLSEQVHLLEQEFAGRINWVYQFFPLEAVCNDVVEKDKHPGACELAYIAAYRPERFREVKDEISANWSRTRDPGWRAELARRYDADAAPTDTATVATVHRLIRTGTEYERTHTQFSHGIRSTPTLIVNGRMIIGTLPYAQLRAILQAALDEETGRGRNFIENWVPAGS
jgi:hypothetical protein